MEKKVVKGNKLRWLFLAMGGVGAVLAIVMLILYSQDRQNYMTVFGFLFFTACAGVSFYYAFHRQESVLLIQPASGRKPSLKPGQDANSINIYIEKNEDGKNVPGALLFEYVSKPKGHPHQLINDNRYYYLHYIYAGKQMKAYTLSDMRYFDPTEFGNVLTMPAHRDLFSYNPSLLQALKPWLLVAGIAIVGVLMVVLAGQ